MDPQTKKLALIAAVMLIAFGLFAAIIESSKALIKGGDPLLEEVNGVTSTATEARINHNGEIVTLPVPEGYCFLDLNNSLDKSAFSIMNNMQRTYSNHLWLVFVDCKQLDAVRASKDMNAYVDTGMIVTPTPFLSTSISADVFATTIKENIKKLDPVKLQDLMSQNMNDNSLLSDTSIKTGQPLIFAENDDEALFFSINHDLSNGAENNLKMTEYNIVTSIKDRPLLVIFTYRDVKDPTAKHGYIENYLKGLRTAN